MTHIKVCEATMKKKKKQKQKTWGEEKKQREEEAETWEEEADLGNKGDSSNAPAASNALPGQRAVIPHQNHFHLVALSLCIFCCQPKLQLVTCGKATLGCNI